MATKKITESQIRKITEQYVKTVNVDAENLDIRDVVRKALQEATSRDLDEKAVDAVLAELSTKNRIDKQAIREAAKKVADFNAAEDLQYTIKNYIKQLRPKGYKITKDDIQKVIQLGKLDPETSTPHQIKNAVKNYFGAAAPSRPSVSDIRDRVRQELKKIDKGKSNEKDVADAAAELIKQAAADNRQITPDDIRTVAAKYVEEPPEEPGQDVQDVAKQKAGEIEPGEPPKPPEPRTMVGDRKKGKGPVSPGRYVAPEDPKRKTFFDKVRERMYKQGLKPLTKSARTWLRQKIWWAAKTPKRQRFIDEGKSLADALMGSMFMYFYDAKHKETLPYWDKFPLIFVVELYEDGWLGINLHYLPLYLRLKLFDKLLELADNNRLDRVTKLKASYALLANFAKFPEVKPCLKRYLASHVRSNLVKIDPVDWEIAVFLPVEQFQKAKKEKVWSDSADAAGK